MKGAIKNFAITGIIIIAMVWIAVDDYIEKEEVEAQKQAIEMKAKELAASKAREVEKRAQEEARKVQLANLAYKNYKTAIPLGDIESLFQEKRFRELEEKLLQVEINSNKDIALYERAFIGSFQSFEDIKDVPHETMVNYFNLWVEETGSYIAYGARGVYLAGKGFQSRGRYQIQNSYKDKVARAVQLWDESLDDLMKSIRMNAKFLPAYVRLISIYRNKGEFEQAEKFFNQVIANVPQTYIARSVMLNYLRPRWAGTFKEADKLVLEAQKYGENNHRLWSLRGIVPSDRGYNCLEDEKYQCAILHYSEALKHVDRVDWLGNQAFAYYKIRDNQQTIKNIDKIIQYTIYKNEWEALKAKVIRREKLKWGDFVINGKVTPKAVQDDFKCHKGAVDSGSWPGMMARWCTIQTGSGLYHGSHRYWYDNGQMKEKSTFTLGNLDGEYQHWYKNGQLDAHGFAKNGDKIGLWKYWNEDGTIKSEVTYTSKLAHQVDFYPSGRKKAKGSFHDGKKLGLWIYWNEQGGEKARCDFKTGLDKLPNEACKLIIRELGSHKIPDDAGDTIIYIQE